MAEDPHDPIAMYAPIAPVAVGDWVGIWWAGDFQGVDQVTRLTKVNFVTTAGAALFFSRENGCEYDGFGVWDGYAHRARPLPAETVIPILRARAERQRARHAQVAKEWPKEAAEALAEAENDEAAAALAGPAPAVAS